jgi:choline kinase
MTSSTCLHSHGSRSQGTGTPERNIMQAIILAAGTSSRLRPLTTNTPKCLLRVGGVSLLERSLRALPGDCIRRAVIVVGFQADLIRDFVGRLSLPFPVAFVANPRFAETNNNASLWQAAPESDGRDILLMDSDILFHPALIPRLLDAPHHSALLLREKGDLGQEEIKVSIDGSDRVRRIGKEIPPHEAAGESIGIEKFSSDAAAALFSILSERHTINEFYERSFQELIDGGTPMHVVRCGEIPCMEIDTVEDFERAGIMAGEIDR